LFSRLQKLQSLEIEDKCCLLPFITDSGLIDVINNCPQINSIIFKSRPKISHETIDALIGLALRKPCIQFKHRFDGIEEEYYFSDSDQEINFIAIDLNSFEFPNNLIIESEGLQQTISEQNRDKIESAILEIIATKKRVYRQVLIKEVILQIAVKSETLENDIKSMISELIASEFIRRDAKYSNLYFYWD
jgi:hypothetical protein